MRAVDKKFLDKYAIDPFDEESTFDSFVEGWVDDLGDEEPQSDEFFVDDWDDLI